MTPEAQRIAISKAAGYEVKQGEQMHRLWCLVKEGEWIGERKSDPAFCWKQTPDWLGDLNSAFEFVEFLQTQKELQVDMSGSPDDKWTVWVFEGGKLFAYIYGNPSLAAAICEGGLRALGLWEVER